MAQPVSVRSRLRDRTWGRCPRQRRRAAIAGVGSPGGTAVDEGRRRHSSGSCKSIVLSVGSVAGSGSRFDVLLEGCAALVLLFLQHSAIVRVMSKW